MYEKHYVIQWRVREWDKWEPLPTKYPSLEDAKLGAKRCGYKLGRYYRIAESYVVVRYKAVKF